MTCNAKQILANCPAILWFSHRLMHVCCTCSQLKSTSLWHCQTRVLSSRLKTLPLRPTRFQWELISVLLTKTDCLCGIRSLMRGIFFFVSDKRDLLNMNWSLMLLDLLSRKLQKVVCFTKVQTLVLRLNMTYVFSTYYVAILKIIFLAIGIQTWAEMLVHFL